MNIAVIEYLNALPYRKAFENLNLPYRQGPPATCVQLAKDNWADLALVSSAELPNLKNYEPIWDLGIGGSGAVLTVGLFGNEKIEACDTIYMDEESRTSVALTKVLCEHYWKKNVVYKPDTSFKTLSANALWLRIGDKAFKANEMYPFKYDLCEVWKHWTGLDFVFARWVKRKGTDFDESGISLAFTKAIESIPSMNLDALSQSYLTQSIQHELGPSHLLGLEKFLELLP